eukprot:TRINITY_DN5401_c0_g1_i18.p1 TRINITY_DN5401_c0_g1~~TRINITY_DN5401_c0_g1_i18.p1  ORF type:complete len:504 (+),score=105.11 TRINITY_DN5401_c0_g1_i18:327-1838(+)
MNLKPDDYFKFIPSYLGSVTVGQPLTWSTSCFSENSATLSITNNVSAVLSVSTKQKMSLFCDDTYLFAYVGSFDITFFEVAWWTHSIDWKGSCLCGNHYLDKFPFPPQFLLSAGGWTESELFDLQTNGIRVFKFPDGIVLSIDELFETALMFFGGLVGAHVPEWTAEDNLKFLQDHMGLSMPERKIQRIDLPKSEFRSGDFLGIIRLDGLDPMLAWGMGSHTGHTAILMWVNNELYVCESTTSSAYWPNNGIQMTPFDEWMDLAEKANYNVVHLPLDTKVADSFDVNSAIKFLYSVKGLPYGFHNLFTGWVDTAEDNYPPPLTSHLAMLLAPFAEWLLFEELQDGQTFDFLAQGLNFRLGVKGLSLTEAYMLASQRGISFTDLVTMPEQDSWIFTDASGVSGPSMVCDVFVTRMWKAGGLFGSIADQIQAAEFTNWDAYSLNIFNANYTRPAACVNADPDSQFCQILGKYLIALPQYNTFKPFPHMRERCPSLPPEYKKPLYC